VSTINPPQDSWPEILKRPVFEVSDLFGKVQSILNEIKLNGDEALRKFTLQFDGVKLDSFLVSEKELMKQNC
jgi:histidinol dehydrogenase